MKSKLKLLSLIGLFLLVGYGLKANSKPQWEQFELNPNYKPTTGKLWTEYRHINEIAFYGGLPENKTTIYLSDLSDENEMGEISESDYRYTIRIDKLAHPLEKEAEITLIHEMCHQADKISNEDEGLDGHSKAFQACMVHVASVGGFAELW